MPYAVKRITTTCVKCESEFNIESQTYRARIRRGSDNLCKKCQSTYISEMKKSDYNSLSDDIKLLRNRNLQLKRKDWFNALSMDQRVELLKPMMQGQQKHNADPNTKELLARRNRNRWKNMTDVEKSKELERLNKIRHDYWNSLTPDSQYNKMSKLWTAASMIGPTESIFEKDLRSIGMEPFIDYHWGYNTYPYEHPEFKKIFGIYNPVTSELNFPYKEWDFILYLKNRRVIVDIDGSSHSPNTMLFYRRGNDYTERMKIDYNDSKRPYQIPDNHKAFIIKVYDDNLTNDIKVLDMRDESVMTYGDFLSMIKNNIKDKQTVYSQMTYVCNS